MKDLDSIIGKNKITLSCNSGTLNSVLGLGISRFKDQQCNTANFNTTATLYKDLDGNTKLVSEYIDMPDAKYYETFMVMFDDCSTYMS